MLQRGVQEQDIAGCEIKHSGEVGKVAGPIHPGREETRSFAEGLFGPDVETTFGWKAGRKCDDGNGERNVEKKPAAEPDDQGRRTVTGGGGNPAKADAGDDIEEEKIAEAHDTGGSGGGDWGRSRRFGGGGSGNAGQKAKPPNGRDGETVTGL